MAQSIRDIVCQINASLETVFKGAKFYGVATSVDREGKLRPVVNDQYVGFDNSFAFQMYHKINQVTTQRIRNTGFGRIEDRVNVFQMSAFVFNNEPRTKLKTDHIALMLDSILATINIISVRILPVNFILNTQAIYSTEYRGAEFSLSEHHSLLQMNYNIEMTLKSGCFEVCPEDFLSSKN